MQLKFILEVVNPVGFVLAKLKNLLKVEYFLTAAGADFGGYSELK